MQTIKHSGVKCIVLGTWDITLVLPLCTAEGNVDPVTALHLFDGYSYLEE